MGLMCVCDDEDISADARGEEVIGGREEDEVR